MKKQLTASINSPGKKERDHTQIGLTNPSVTMECDIGNFLKCRDSHAKIIQAGKPAIIRRGSK
jgi:hypothetical protein